MSESLFPPFLKWGEFTSRDDTSPDVLTVAPTETETFETEYTINVKAIVNGTEKVIPLQSFESRNKQLLQLWNKAKKENKIQVGKEFKMKTWLGVSKNKHPIRRFELVF